MFRNMFSGYKYTMQVLSQKEIIVRLITRKLTGEG